MDIIVGTNNNSKLKEMQDSIGNPTINLISYTTIINKILNFEETGKTFRENAIEKATNYTNYIEQPVLADDGGLILEAFPELLGIKTARFFSKGASDSQKNEELLKLLENKSDSRKLTLFSTISYVYPDGKVLLVEEKLEGELAEKETGALGYGFDRIFYLPNRGKTLAELADDERNSYSPRVCALKKIIQLIEEES